MQKKKNWFSSFLELALLVLFFIGILAVLTLPLWVKWYVEFHYGTFTLPLYIKMLVILYISGILAVASVWECHAILHNINLGKPFIMDNAKRLRRIAWCFLPIALTYFISMFLIPSPFVLLVGAAFAFGCAILFLLSELFRQAVQYKEENDLTI